MSFSTFSIGLSTIIALICVGAILSYMGILLDLINNQKVYQKNNQTEFPSLFDGNKIDRTLSRNWIVINIVRKVVITLVLVGFQYNKFIQIGTWISTNLTMCCIIIQN